MKTSNVTLNFARSSLQRMYTAGFRSRSKYARCSLFMAFFGTCCDRGRFFVSDKMAAFAVRPKNKLFFFYAPTRPQEASISVFPSVRPAHLPCRI